MGNIIQSKDGQLFIIDWHTVNFDNYGDPWYEFNRIGTEYPAFATGQIDGYFNHEPPEVFWRLLVYYLSASAITSIINLNVDILRWFDNMKKLVPTWYLKDFCKNNFPTLAGTLVEIQ